MLSVYSDRVSFPAFSIQQTIATAVRCGPGRCHCHTCHVEVQLVCVWGEKGGGGGGVACVRACVR